jgi:TolA-binding protein
MRNRVHRLNFNTTIHVLAMLLVFGVTPQQAQGASDADGDFGFAEHLIRDEMYDLAAQQLQLFIENHPASEHTPDAFLLLADAYIKREEYSRAADTFQGFTIKYPQDVRVRGLWLKQALFRARAGQHADAARDFLQLADAYPESDFADDALLGAARALVAMNEFERAERALVRQIERYDTGDAIRPARILLAQVRLERGDLDAAERILRPVLQQRSFSDDLADGLLTGVRIAVTANNIGEAKRLSDRLTAQAPGDDRTWQARMIYAECALHRGETLSDRELLNQAADLYKETSRRATSTDVAELALFNLAHVRELQDSPTLALSNWKDFLENYPASNRRPRAILGLGRAHLSAGNDRDGVFALEEILSMYPDSVEARLALGELGDYYLARGDDASALAYYERQLKITPDGIQQRTLMLTIADLRLIELGEPENAQPIFEELAEGSDQIAAHALFGLAASKRALGKLDDAEHAYRQVTRRFPAHELASAALDSLTLMNLFLRPDISGATMALFELDANQLLSVENETVRRRERLLELAKIRINYLKNYEGAIELLTSYLKDSSAYAPDIAEHLLAQCALRLSTRAKLGQDAVAEQTYRQDALAALDRLATNHPQSDLADDAYIETTEANLTRDRSDSSPQTVLDAYQGFSERYPSSDRLDYVLVRVAESAVNGAAEGVGSPGTALQEFNHAIEFAPNGPVLDRALFGSSLILKGDGHSDEALLRLERLIAERPLSTLVPESRYQLANLHLEAGRPRKAARELEKLLRGGALSRSSDEVRLRLILAYREIDAYQELAPVARELTLSDDADAAALGARYLAAAYLHLREPGKAATILETELATRPDAKDADSLAIRRAEILFGINRPDLVTAFLSGFERRYPSSIHVPAAWRMLAHVQFDQGLHEEALANYRRVLQADAQDKEARLGEAIALYRLGRADEAGQRERSLRDVTTLTSDDEIRLSLEEGHALFRARDFLGAIDAFAKVVQDHPESEWADDALIAQGRAATQSGRIEPAVVAFEKLIRDFPDSPLRQRAAFELGNAYLAMKLYEQAVETYLRVQEMDAGTIYMREATWNLILSYEKIQRFDSAIRTMRSFRANFPDHPRVPRMYVKIAENLNELGEFQDAVTAYQEAFDRVTGEDLVNARFGLGEAYYNLGEYRLAVVEWLKMAYHGQTQSHWAITALFRAAKANEKMGHTTDAASLYEKIVTIEGESSDLGSAAALELLRLNEAKNSAP